MTMRLKNDDDPLLTRSRSAILTDSFCRRAQINDSLLFVSAISRGYRDPNNNEPCNDSPPNPDVADASCKPGGAVQLVESRASQRRGHARTCWLETNAHEAKAAEDQPVNEQCYRCTCTGNE